jgi:8-oxo-dGTP diphosphatase
MGGGPTAIDRGYRLAYRVAHGLLRLYWGVRHPHKGGVLIAIWNEGELLIVKNTYRRQRTLPGGYPHAGETPAQTGERELAEECDVRVSPDALKEVYRAEHLFEGRRDDVTIVEVHLPTRPTVRIDNREVSDARFAKPRDILALDIVPHLREYLEQKVGTPPSPLR